jgi:hypothetical protein
LQWTTTSSPGLPAGDALADLPDDAGGVGAADVVVLVVVAEDGDGLAERGPHVVEVDPRGHHADGHLERAGLGHLHLLELERVERFALTLLADDPCGHGGRELSGLHVQLRHILRIDRHVLVVS